MECKRNGKGNFYDVRCMLCKKYNQCVPIQKEIERRISHAHIDCKKCENILQCKKYSCGVCKKFNCDLAINGFDACDDCSCLQTCIDKFCKDVKYICKKDIYFKRCLINELFTKDNEYTFKVFENKVIYNNSLLSFIDSNIFNEYFEEIR